MGSQRGHVGARIDPGCDYCHTLRIYLGSINGCTCLYLDIFQIPFSFGIAGTAEGADLILDVNSKGQIIVSLHTVSGTSSAKNGSGKLSEEARR